MYSKESDPYTNINKVDSYDMDTIFVSDDSEWYVAHKSQDDEERTQDDIISHQYVIKLPGYPAMEVVLYRHHNDKPFSFWDILQVIRFYLTKVKYRGKYTERDFSRLAKQLGRKKNKIQKKIGKFTTNTTDYMGWFLWWC